MARKKEESFEALLEETETLTVEIEAGALPLDEALKKYEKGVGNLRACAKLLQAAEEKVKVLVQETQGEFKLEEFAGAAEEAGKDGEDA